MTYQILYNCIKYNNIYLITWCVYVYDNGCDLIRARFADVAGNNNLTRTKSQYHRTHPGRLVNFSSFRVSNRHQQQPQQPQQQQPPQLQTSYDGGPSAVARAVATGSSRLLSASAFGNTLQQHRQLQQRKRDDDAAPSQLPIDNGTAAESRFADRKPGTTSATFAGTTLRYCKSVSPIAEKPPARRSPPRSASMNLQPRNFTAAEPYPRWCWWPHHPWPATFLRGTYDYRKPCHVQIFFISCWSATI